MILNLKFFTAVCFTIFYLMSTDVIAQVSLPKIIGHNMVLQRNQQVPIWGTALAGEKITVTFEGQSKQTVADANGAWKVRLDAMKANAVPQQMMIAGKNKIELNNILIGEVWLCSGQSNMEYTMRKNSKVIVPQGKDWPVNELETAHNPAIRIFLDERKKMNPDPKHLGWSVAEDSALRSFSAAGYFFAKKLHEELGVPVGIISASIPGSRIEPWMPREAFLELPFFQQQTDSTHKIDGDPGKFYTTMIQPLIPFALRGFLWYQGESNCFLGETMQYTYKMQALMNWWRKEWNNTNMPFYYVQIAPYEYSKTQQLTVESLSFFREAQEAVMQRVPHTGMVVTTDLNDTITQLHPQYKWEIGKRLALLALNKDYGKKEIVYSGPVFKSVEFSNHEAIVSFDEVQGGLKSSNGEPLNSFTIAGKDGKFFPAKAAIKGDKVIVTADAVAKSAAVRMGWNEDDRPNLTNGSGIPARQFRTEVKSKK
jgi:sialate O-acetylesterase